MHPFYESFFLEIMMFFKYPVPAVLLSEKCTSGLQWRQRERSSPSSPWTATVSSVMLLKAPCKSREAGRLCLVRLIEHRPEAVVTPCPQVCAAAGAACGRCSGATLSRMSSRLGNHVSRQHLLIGTATEHESHQQKRLEHWMQVLQFQRLLGGGATLDINARFDQDLNGRSIDFERGMAVA